MSNTKVNTTAILIFANSSTEELKHKTIVKATTLFDTLTAHTINTVTKSKLPYFHITEKQQVGDTFGERFINAIEAVFNKGYDQVITVGNDTPQLQASQIIKAAKELNAKKFVLGTSTDGGFYIMGIHKSQFNASVLKKLAWQTPHLSKQIIRFITISSIEVIRFKTLQDIDTVSDIKKLLNYAYKIPKQLRILFLGIVALKKHQIRNNIVFLPHLHYKTNYNKGSPLIYFS